MRWFERRRKREAELEREMRAHLEAEAEEQRAGGLSAQEARDKARQALGNVTSIKEDVRGSWGWMGLDQMARDLRVGLRGLGRSPGFALTAILSLALGIGANTAIFTIVNAVLLRPLPFAEPEQLLHLWEANPSRGYTRNVVNPLNFLNWRERTRSFQGMAAFSARTMDVTGDGGPVGVHGMLVTPEIFSVLGVTPLLGRTFRQEEGTPGGSDVAILGYGLWQSRYGGDRSILGRRIHANGTAVTVIGVMPRGFAMPDEPAEIWIPVPIARSKEWNYGRWLDVIARLKPGVTVSQAAQDLKGVAAQLVVERPDFDQGWTAEAMPMLADVTSDVRRPLLVLLSAVGLVLLIACANAANLLLMRASGRRHEMAVRAALGASRRRLLQQLLSESLAMAALSCALGIAIGYAGLKGLLALLPDDSHFPRLASIAMDGQVFLFAALLALVCALLFGLAPALQVSEVRPQRNLNLSSVRVSSRGSLRRALVVVEIALSVLLLAGAGLLLRSFHRLLAVNPGFSVERVISMNIVLSRQYEDDGKRAAYFERLLAEVRAVPGVSAAGSIHFLPLQNRTSGSCFSLTGDPKNLDASSPDAAFLVASPGYFETMRVPLLAGRLFNESDRYGKPNVVIVNQQLARRFFAGRNPVGQKLAVCWSGQNPVEIAGVVADARQTDLKNTPEPTIFINNFQAPEHFADLVVRTAGDPERMARSIESAIHRVNPDQAVTHVKTIEQVYSDSVAQPRLQLILLGVFAGMAALLAVVGVYGVISYAVAQRTREIGIRMALGARVSDVGWSVVREGLVLGAFGVALGLAASLALTRLLGSLLFETAPRDVATLASVTVLILAVVLLATTIPAYRAAQTNPLDTLRYE